MFHGLLVHGVHPCGALVATAHRLSACPTLSGHSCGLPLPAGPACFPPSLPSRAFPLLSACGLPCLVLVAACLAPVSPGGHVPRFEGFPAFGESVLLKRNLLVKIYLRKRKICDIKNHAAKNGARRQSPQPVRRRRAGRRPKRRMAPCRNGIQTVAAWISKIPRNHEPMPGWAGTETGRPGRGRHIRLKARQHMHGMQCHVCRKRWGGSIRGYLIRRGATSLKGELAPFAQRLTTGVAGRLKRQRIRRLISGESGFAGGDLRRYRFLR